MNDIWLLYFLLFGITGLMIMAGFSLDQSLSPASVAHNVYGPSIFEVVAMSVEIA